LTAINNYDVANFSAEIFNDEIHDTVLNVTIEYKEEITKFQIEIKLSTQINENDKNFERELIRTNVNLGKMMNGIQGNYFLRAFMEAFAKSADFEMKLPFKKVSIAIFIH
jgi:outer membrane cobalamin receptor